MGDGGQDYFSQQPQEPVRPQPARLPPHRQRLVDFLHQQAPQWSSKRQIIEGARLEPRRYHTELQWLRAMGAVEYRRVSGSDLPRSQRGGSALEWMVRLRPGWPGQPAGDHAAVAVRQRLRSPMVAQAACLSLAARVTQRIQPHLPAHGCRAAVCPAVRLACLSAQARARLRPLLAGLTGPTGHQRAWAPWDDEHGLSEVYTVWQDLCTLAGGLGLNPSESINDGYEYALGVADLLSQELPAAYAVGDLVEVEVDSMEIYGAKVVRVMPRERFEVRVTDRRWGPTGKIIDAHASQLRLRRAGNVRPSTAPGPAGSSGPAPRW